MTVSTPLTAILLCTLLPGSYSWSILIANVFAGGSHQLVSSYLANLLAEHGHHVTYLSTNTPSKLHPSVVKLDLPDSAAIANAVLKASTGSKKGEKPYTWGDVFGYLDMLFSSCQRFYEEPNVQALMKTNNKKFDLFITFVLFDPCGLSLAHYLGIENTVLHSPGPIVFPHHISLLGLPIYSSSHKLDALTLADPSQLRTSMVARAKQLLKMQFTSFIQTFYTRYYIEPVVYQHVPNYPGYKKIYENVRMIFMHYHPHPLVDQPHPLGPGVVNLGGTLCNIGYNDDDLTPELRDFIATADNFIFISFGSLLPTLSVEEEKTWIAAFSKLPYNVIWKLSDHSETLPANVKTFKWLPQMALMQHPKMKLFITHGGYGSKIEAFCSGIPMVIVPRFALDQFYNARHYKEIGVAENIMDIANAKSEDVHDVIVKAIEEHTAVMQVIKRQVLTTRITDEQVLGYIDMAISGQKMLPGYQPFWEYFYLDIIFIPIALIYLIKFVVRKIRG